MSILKQETIKSYSGEVEMCDEYGGEVTVVKSQLSGDGEVESVVVILCVRWKRTQKQVLHRRVNVGIVVPNTSVFLY
jgi:hypothetical protein